MRLIAAVIMSVFAAASFAECNLLSQNPDIPTISIHQVEDPELREILVVPEGIGGNADLYRMLVTDYWQMLTSFETGKPRPFLIEYQRSVADRIIKKVGEIIKLINQDLLDIKDVSDDIVIEEKKLKGLNFPKPKYKNFAYIKNRKTAMEAYNAAVIRWRHEHTELQKKNIESAKPEFLASWSRERRQIFVHALELYEHIVAQIDDSFASKKFL